MSPEFERSLPDLTPLLKAGAQVYLVVHKDALRERIDVRPTRVLGLEGDVLFLAQTEPPLGPEQDHGLESTLEVALVVKVGEGSARTFGYSARLLDLRQDYPDPDHPEGVAALAVTAPAAGEAFETSLRMHFRISVDAEMGVAILLAGYGEVELLDFSAGGARVRIQGPAHIARGERVPFKLLFLGSGYADGDGVVRSVEAGGEGGPVILGLCFTNMEIRDIRYLERMVARIGSASRQREREAGYSAPEPAPKDAC